MSKIYNTLNVNSENELMELVESLNLDDNQYIEFMTVLNSDLSEDGLKMVLENLTKSWYNGSYEKLQEQCSKKKPSAKRELKKVEEDTVYDHSWYEVEGGKYPKRTKEGVIIKESYDEPIQVWNLELRKNPYISREEIFKAKEIFFKEICDHADEYPNFKELVKVLQSLLDKGLINDKQYKFCRTNWDDLFGEYDPDVYGDSDITESVIKEAKEEVIEDEIKEEPVEEKPVSTADPELAKFIEQSEKVIDATTNSDILSGLLNSIEAKIQLASDVEQMNKLGELKQKAETKINASNVTPVAESYDPDDEEWFDVGDQVCFKWNLEGNPNANLTGTVREVQTIGGNRYYNIASYNNETGRVENYYRVCPVSNEMKMVREPEDTIEKEVDETCSSGCCGASSVSGFAKRLGKAPKKKKRLPEAIDTKLFKESILNNMPCESVLEGHQFKYFMNEGVWYLSCDNALVKTYNKYDMIDTIDEIVNGEEPSCGLLEGYSCYEMNLLMEEDISATGDMAKDEFNTALIASAKKANDGTLTPEEENELNNSVDDPNLINQNKEAAGKLSLKVGQQVSMIDPETSKEEDSELSGVDKDKGLAYLKNKTGEIQVQPASKVQVKA